MISPPERVGELREDARHAADCGDLEFAQVEVPLRTALAHARRAKRRLGRARRQRSPRAAGAWRGIGVYALLAAIHAVTFRWC
ncbi:MAG TPA: hypothetical protein VM737_07285 [Gemmatimonadota bacterium]|nr:hypothetical protein [Gemmatimonadota bacterium]